MASTVPTNQQDSPFLNLPAELRNYIYEMICAEPTVAIIVAANGKAKVSDTQNAISRTCRQLRQEASPIAIAALVDCKTIKSFSYDFKMPPRACVVDLIRSIPCNSASGRWTYTEHVFVGPNFTRNIAIDDFNKLVSALHVLHDPEQRETPFISTLELHFDHGVFDTHQFGRAIDMLGTRKQNGVWRVGTTKGSQRPREKWAVRAARYVAETRQKSARAGLRDEEIDEWVARNERLARCYKSHSTG